jgi:hypothetical protein
MGFTVRTVKRVPLLFIVILLLLIAAFAYAAPVAAAGPTRFVNGSSGTDSGSCSSAATACKTIQFAVNHSQPGEIIIVFPGTYKESIDIDHRLILKSTNVSSTIIDATGFLNGILIHGPGTAGSGLFNFTVENANQEGVVVQSTSFVTLEGNHVINNDKFFSTDESQNKCPAENLDDCGEAIHLLSVKLSNVRGNLVQHNIGGILLTDELGPTAFNLISGNTVLDNGTDCGITLASHFFQLGGPVGPANGGVYGNSVLFNTSNRNGAAGIGVFAGPPGAAAYNNVVANNIARDNGLPGVAIHSHTPFQNANGNVVTNNTLSGNGPDDDAQTPGGAGVVVFSDVASGATPIKVVVVSANRIDNEDIGIYASGVTHIVGLPSNKFGSNVGTPIVIH